MTKLQRRNNLRACRAKNGLTGQDVADHIGITKVSYSYKETGKNEFTESEINKLLELFDESYEDIFLD